MKKKLLAMVLALVMCLSMSTLVFADDGDGVLTVDAKVTVTGFEVYSVSYNN